ncbi:MAG: methionyl-tRNA formyltransferase [Parachlamydiaceae bacterium]
MKVIYFGTPRFAAEVLSFLLDHGIDVVAVVTKPDRPQGRSAQLVPTPVKCVAETHSPPIPVFQPELISSPENIPLLEKFQADLFVVVAYGEIIKQHLLDMPKIACINLHASLLPKYRGAAPIQRVIMNGETETGITIMHMVKKMDAGDIIAVEKVPIGIQTTYGELEADLCRVGADLLLQTIHNFERGATQRVPQDHSLATTAPKIESEDCLIKWNLPAESIHNMVRGVNPHPGAWCWVSLKGEKKRLRVMTTEVVVLATEASDVKSMVINPTNGIVIRCGHGALRLVQIQLEGKKSMTSDEFIRGYTHDSLLFL